MPEILDLTGPQTNYAPPLSEALSPDGTTLIDMTKPVEAKPDEPKADPAPDAPPAEEAAPEEVKPEVKDEPKPDLELEPPTDKTPPWMKAKITKAENRRREAEAKAAESDALLRKMLERVASGEAPSAPTNEPPKPEGFATSEKYAEAYIDWQVQHRLNEALGRAEQARAEHEQQRRAQEMKSAYQQRLEKARTDHPDFDAVAFDDALPITKPMGVAIVKSAIGPEVQYYLGTHREEAAEISQMDDVDATMAIGRIAFQLKNAAAAPKPEVSKAPKPITPVGSRNAAGKSAENETMAEYEARRSRELYPERFKRAGL